jgi:hypothetical protein
MSAFRKLLFAAVVAALSSLTFAQSDMKHPDANLSGANLSGANLSGANQSEAKQSFDKLKTLAGTWEGRVTTDPPSPDMDNKAVKGSLRVTSMGNAIVHEMTGADRPDDPITMFYIDGDRLLLTHYCDAGNRPRMVGKVTPDGKSVEFEFLDVSGSTKYGHMHHAVFTVIDANHHTEDWTYMQPGDKPVRAHMDLQRTK